MIHKFSLYLCYYRIKANIYAGVLYWFTTDKFSFLLLRFPVQSIPMDVKYYHVPALLRPTWTRVTPIILRTGWSVEYVQTLTVIDPILKCLFPLIYIRSQTWIIMPIVHGLSSTSTQTKSHWTTSTFFDDHIRSSCKELVNRCLGKNWTISTTKIAKKQNWKEKAVAELIKFFLDWNVTWMSCTSCYNQASQEKVSFRRLFCSSIMKTFHSWIFATLSSPGHNRWTPLLYSNSPV